MGVYWMNKCAQAVKNLDQEAAKVRNNSIQYRLNKMFVMYLGNKRSISKKFRKFRCWYSSI